MDSVGQEGEGAGRSHPIVAPLLELGAQSATGVFVATNGNGDESQIWLRDGFVYAVSVPGRRPLLGVRLVSSGIINPEALAEALEVQRTEMQGWRLGELLVHLGFVQRPVIDEYVTEQLNDQFADLIGWAVRATLFRNGEHTRSDMTVPHEVPELLAEASARRVRWAAVLERVGGPETVPDLESRAASQSDLGPHEWAMLCKVDSVRSVTDLADECGFTLYEAARLVADLQEAGLVSLPRSPLATQNEQPLAKVLQLHPTPTSAVAAPAVATPTAEAPATEPPATDPTPSSGSSENWARMAQAASQLTELASDHDLSELIDREDLDRPTPAAPEDPEPDDEFDDYDDPAEPEPENGADFTDTASLLRELSSLGGNDEGTGARQSAQPSTPGAADRSKRRRGFLGR